MSFPEAPHNLSVISPYIHNALDLRWDNPAMLMGNSQYKVVGTNIYRAFDSEFGPFKKINDIPIGAVFYRDSVKLDVIIDENVSSSFLSRGDSEDGKWVFRVDKYPIMKQTKDTNLHKADHRDDVVVTIDGVVVPVFKVQGNLGTVELIASPVFNAVTQRLDPPILPSSDSVVLCTYRNSVNALITAMNQRVFYRLTTIVEGDGAYIETPIENTTSVSAQEIERLDYIWTEAIRRNRWILGQGGERVKVFLKRHVGIDCSCWYSTKEQPKSDCKKCFGTGVLGGYDGPFDIILAPDESNKKKYQTDLGRRLEHSWDAWTGPSPLLSHRDFIVRQNGDRYTIGAPSIPSVRGAILQQHFTMNFIDSQDIRYFVPVLGVSDLAFPGTRLQTDGSNVYPQITDKSEIGDERELRGRTVVWENITY